MRACIAAHLLVSSACALAHLRFVKSRRSYSIKLAICATLQARVTLARRKRRKLKYNDNAAVRYETPEGCSRFASCLFLKRRRALEKHRVIGKPRRISGYCRDCDSPLRNTRRVLARLRFVKSRRKIRAFLVLLAFAARCNPVEFEMRNILM